MSALNLLCVLTNLPSSPIVHFQNLSLQLYTVNRAICPHIDPNREVTFQLFTRANLEESQQIKINNDTLLKKSNIDFTKKTIFFVHGFMESFKSDNAMLIKNNYLKVGDKNVILVDAERLYAGLDYFTAAANVQAVGTYIGGFIDYLVTKGLKLSDLHLVGMSLGGQTVGVAGSKVKTGKVARITGLDPAGPLFIGLPESKRIDKSDGEFVDIIHTNPGLFGYPASCGHVDFYLNGGRINFVQPGCSPVSVLRRAPLYIPEYIFCSHWRSYQIFAESILNGKDFPATKCDSWIKYKTGRCSENEVSYVGEDVDLSAQGDYYFKSASQYPYTLKN